MIQKNITLGTAGHIDHGKTALVKNLTGCETDRLKEEQERGMSIELGFAPWRVQDLEVGIVDVPGHENFIKTMVAGATGIDAVVFVIAADDGVMPQTREHLDILTLLGVQSGVVVLTKTDKVSAEHLELARQEAQDYLQNTFLRDAPIYPVSNITGAGFGEFYDGLTELVQRLTPKHMDGVFRLPVERTFSIKGYGTIISGIPVSGTTRVGDAVTAYPSGATGRIKAIQVYSEQSDVVRCGQCAAINVPQWEHGTISRGDVVTVEGWFEPRDWYLCQLNVLPGEGTYLKNGASVKFHTGTSETTAVVYLLRGDRAEGGRQVLVQVQLNQSIVAGPMDRFILRSYSPVRTIGGGVIVEVLERKLRRSHPEVVADAEMRAAAVQNARDFAEYVIRTAPDYVITTKATAQRIKRTLAGTEQLIDELIQSGIVCALDQGHLMHMQTAEQLRLRVVDRLAEYHEKDPASPGMAMDTLQTEFNWPRQAFAKTLRDLTTNGEVCVESDRVRLGSHRAQMAPAMQKMLEQVEALFRERRFSPPNRDELMELAGLDAKGADTAIRLLIEHKRLARVDRDICFHIDAVSEAVRLAVEHLKKNNRLESVEWKYMIDATRKYALPLLDYFDRIGVTKRAPDNTRHLGPKSETWKTSF